MKPQIYSPSVLISRRTYNFLLLFALIPIQASNFFLFFSYYYPNFNIVALFSLFLSKPQISCSLSLFRSETQPFGSILLFSIRTSYILPFSFLFYPKLLARESHFYICFSFLFCLSFLFYLNFKVLALNPVWKGFSKYLIYLYDCWFFW